MVETYAHENRGLKVGEILKKQAGSYYNWKIPYVLREYRKDIPIVKIRRPRVLNALNDEVVEQLREIFIEIQKYPKIKGAILTGFGIRALENILSGKIKIAPIPRGPIPIPEKLPEVDIGHLSRKIDSLLQQAILEGARMTLDEGLKLEAKLFGECWLTKDMRIGMENFMKN